MSEVRVATFSVSIDGFGAGPRQDLQNPLGVRGLEMHDWFFHTDVFKTIQGQDRGETGVDNRLALRAFDNVGAWIIGRNMFGPIRGPWNGDDWKGWWGDNPPFHTPVIVLTHYARAPLTMNGGTTFYFVTGGPEDALARAREAGGGKDIRIGGGVSTVRQYLTAGKIEEVHLALAPVLLGEGEHLFAGINLNALGFSQIEKIEGERATHLIIRKRRAPTT